MFLLVPTFRLLSRKHISQSVRHRHHSAPRDMASTKKFDGKVVLVTGGGQGIGRAICLNYAQAGASVIIADTDAEAGIEVESIINSYPSTPTARAFFVETDVASDASVASLAEVVGVNFEKVDVLVNNAGISQWCDIEAENALEHFDNVLGVNLRRMYSVTKHILPFMKSKQSDPPQSRSIINIGSTRALMSEPNTEAYSASKGGIVALTHALAISLAKYRIRVNAISPGWIDVQDYRKSSLLKQFPSVPLKQSDHDQHPARRVGKADDIAKACLYLSNSDADFITGQNLVIDGGMTVKMIYDE